MFLEARVVVVSKARCINAINSLLHLGYETFWFLWVCLLGLMFLYTFGLFSVVKLVIRFIEEYTVHTSSSLRLHLERHFWGRRLIAVTCLCNSGQMFSFGVSRRQPQFLCPPSCYQPMQAVRWEARRAVGLTPVHASICMTQRTGRLRTSSSLGWVQVRMMLFQSRRMWCWSW